MSASVALGLGLLLATPAGSAAPPSDQTLVYYNARMALREGRPAESVQLWLLRNAIEGETSVVSAHDGDFSSVTWAALTQMGLCPDGQPRDDDGAGLWPIAMHNWVVRNLGSRPAPRAPRTFDALEVGRQQKAVAIGDVLQVEEIERLQLRRGRCFGPRLQLVAVEEWPWTALSDRDAAARLLRHLLVTGRETLAEDGIRGRAVLDARIFDLDLQLAALAEREAREAASSRARLGRRLGLAPPSVDDIRRAGPGTTLDPDSVSMAILLDAASWPVSEWMRIDPERRAFLFDQARAHTTHTAALDGVALGILDALVAAGDGRGALAWTPRVVRQEPARRALVWRGERGQRLLSLSPEDGFSERPVIALHRGVAALEAGDLADALSSLSWALTHADESRRPAEVAGLSRRWLSYVSSRYALTPELLTTLQALVPRRDYALILEDLMWRAVFAADGASFAAGLAAQPGRGALDRRLLLMRPLAEGDPTRFLRSMARGLDQRPGETLRFLRELVLRLEGEDAAARARHRATVVGLRSLLQALADNPDAARRQVRLAQHLLASTQAILAGSGGLSADPSVADRARAMSPDQPVFVGAVRLAPADPLPWPFGEPTSAPPSAFTQIPLTPVEWRDDAGTLVFGWAIGQ